MPSMITCVKRAEKFSILENQAKWKKGWIQLPNGWWSRPLRKPPALITFQDFFQQWLLKVPWKVVTFPRHHQRLGTRHCQQNQKAKGCWLCQKQNSQPQQRLMLKRVETNKRQRRKKINRQRSKTTRLDRLSIVRLKNSRWILKIDWSKINTIELLLRHRKRWNLMGVPINVHVPVEKVSAINRHWKWWHLEQQPVNKRHRQSNLALQATIEQQIQTLPSPQLRHLFNFKLANSRVKFSQHGQSLAMRVVPWWQHRFAWEWQLFPLKFPFYSPTLPVLSFWWLFPSSLSTQWWNLHVRLIWKIEREISFYDRYKFYSAVFYSCCPSLLQWQHFHVQPTETCQFHFQWPSLACSTLSFLAKFLTWCVPAFYWSHVQAPWPRYGFKVPMANVEPASKLKLPWYW